MVLICFRLICPTFDSLMLTEDVHPVLLPPERLLAECRLRLVRRGGPGGQHRNKVETGVELTHVPTGVRAEATERRGQAVNRSVALRRLRVNLALAVRTAPTTPAEPSALWRSRRSAAGILRVAADHEDFPAVLAEALDAIGRFEDDLRQAAEALGTSPSQLVKLLGKEPRALAAVNQRRRDRGLAALR